jgi:hypothetical protein
VVALIYPFIRSLPGQVEKRLRAGKALWQGGLSKGLVLDHVIFFRSISILFQ